MRLLYDNVRCFCAGELMQSERDALLKLIQSLRHEYEAVQAAKMGQESEIQGLKVLPSQSLPWHLMCPHDNNSTSTAQERGSKPCQVNCV